MKNAAAVGEKTTQPTKKKGLVCTLLISASKRKWIWASWAQRNTCALRLSSEHQYLNIQLEAVKRLFICQRQSGSSASSNQVWSSEQSYDVVINIVFSCLLITLLLYFSSHLCWRFLRFSDSMCLTCASPLHNFFYFFLYFYLFNFL